MSAAAKTSRRPGEDLRPPGVYSGVGIARLGAGARFHDDLEPGFQEVRNHRGHQRHAALARVALARDSDDHQAASSRENSASRRRDPKAVSYSQSGESPFDTGRNAEERLLRGFEPCYTLGVAQETESTHGTTIMGTPTGRVRIVLTSALLYAAAGRGGAGRRSERAEGEDGV